MTDRELVDALRSTTSRSKRKLLDAAADRIESTIRARTTIDDETICGFPVRDLVVAATVMRRSSIEPEDLRKLCHNLDFAFNVAWEELEKTIERAMAERAKAYLVTANHFAAERKMIMSKKLPDLTGEHFGRWTVIEYAGRGNHGEVQYKCRCDCGAERIIRRTSLTSGNSRSCGCLSRDTAKERGTTHGDSKIRLYRIWAGIIQRCCNDRERYEWEKYGGRGINVCTEWHKYEAFRDWALSNGYSDELTIDRIDVNGDYCPNNCRWATVYEQNNNKRTSKYISFNGKTGTVREFADEYGLAYSCLYERLKLGWSIEKALLTPSRKVV